MALWISNASAASCTDNFTGASGGDWSTPGNWDIGVPGQNDIACFSGKTVVVSGGAREADSVQGGTLSITDGSLTLTGANGSSLTGLTITGGNFNAGANNSTVSLAGDFDWNVPNGGSSNFGAQGDDLTIAQTGTHSFKIEGQGTESFTRGSMTTTNPVSITNTNFNPNNFPGPSLTTTDNVTFNPGSYGGSPLALTAKGITFGGGDVSGQYSLHLTGSTSSLGGNLTLAGLSTASGTTLTIPSGKVLTAGSGAISGKVTGPGSYTHDGLAGSIASGGELSPASVTIATGTLTLDSGGTYSPSGMTTINGGVNFGVLELSNNASTGGLTINGGNLNAGTNDSTITVAGNFDWNVPNGGSSNIGAQGQNPTIAQTGTHSFKIRGQGTESFTRGSMTTTNPVSITNANFNPNNSPGPNLTTQSTTTFTQAGAYSGSNLHLFTNGLITAAGATTLPYDIHLTGGTTSIGVGNPLTADQVTVAGGTLDVSGGLTAAHANVSGGTLSVGGTLTAPVDMTGGALKGTGTVDADVTNASGTIAPGDSPGTLTITGSYDQQAAGTLAEQITGTTPGTQFDRLIVDGDATLDGTLAIDSHTFSPGLHDTFKIISAGSRSGTFAHLTGATVNGDTYSPQYDTDGVTLNVSGPDRSPPTITISTPASGAHYKQGQKVLASYSCADPDGPGDVALCQGPAPNGKPIDTTTAGDHTFTVQASDQVGNTSSKTVHYTVDTTESSPPAVHGFPPDQGCVPGRLKLKISVHPTRLRRASVFLDNKLIASSTKHNFKVTISGKRLSPGRHTIKILREYKSGTKRKSTFSFTRCKKGGKSPHIHTEGTPDRGSCTAKPFSIHVSITRVDVKTIRVTLDGKPFAKPGKATFTLSIDVRKLKAGPHKLIIKATDKLKNGSVSITDFARCA